MTPILGGLPPATFLRRHWQKRPLLVRQAFPGFAGIVARDQLLGLATREDAVSRLVIEHPRRSGRGRWERHDGPFAELDAGLLPRSHWTVLVHGVESLVPGGWELLRAFSFIPMARIDDLMVSWAADGGSVGPHHDDYDVFLLQGAGRRRWQISVGGDRARDPEAAIEVLARFVPEEEWVLEPGDMLYLPPGVAHLGVADGPCSTYSIGFLAPSHEEIVRGFLGWLGGALPVDARARYADPDLKPPPDPFAIGDAMVRRIGAVVRSIRWSADDVEDFVGCFLTRPKPHVVFAPPARALEPDELARRLRGRGRLALALPSRGLSRGERVFLNGEAHRVPAGTRGHARALFADRALELPLRLDRETLALFHRWFVAGFVRLL